MIDGDALKIVNALWKEGCADGVGMTRMNN